MIGRSSGATVKRFAEIVWSFAVTARTFEVIVGITGKTGTISVRISEKATRKKFEGIAKSSGMIAGNCGATTTNCARIDGICEEIAASIEVTCMTAEKTDGISYRTDMIAPGLDPMRRVSTVTRAFAITALARDATVSGRVVSTGGSVQVCTAATDLRRRGVPLLRARAVAELGEAASNSA